MIGLAMRTGHADLPLHRGHAPRWLFERMVALSREMALAVLAEERSGGLLRRLADPVWFQAFGCVLGFDWHSSGLTTTVCGALKEGLRPVSGTGLVIAGGKGRASRRTPAEIEAACWRTGQEAAPLVRASRLSAKVDSAAVQDGFEVYHHTFLFTADGAWAVVQQGMSERTGMARRYHWLTPPCFDRDPHSAVAGAAEGTVLNLVAAEAEGNRAASASLAREEPGVVIRELERVRTLAMPRRHQVLASDVHPDRLRRLLLGAHEVQPADFTALLAVQGLGARTLRALSLVAELAYGEPASVRDPVSYSFAHGGKDGTPYPVDRRTYDATIDSLHRALADARVGRNEKVAALRRLAHLPPPPEPGAPPPEPVPPSPEPAATPPQPVAPSDRPPPP
jgi:uncharacterized protein